MSPTSKELIELACMPVCWAWSHIHGLMPARIARLIAPGWGKTGFGVALMLLGSLLASTPMPILPHVTADAFAYFLHGFGAAPVIRHLCERLGLWDWR